jgi:SAM-dependent methyltransferase
MDSGRTKKQLQEHYRIEKKLAQQLLNASTSERKILYPKLYDELLRRVPDHPMLARKDSQDQQKAIIQEQIGLISRLVISDSTYLEIGAGDCAVTLEVAKLVKHAYAVDVSKTITSGSVTPENFSLIISDGTSIPVPDESIDLAYSNQLMEHLHPDDALMQLRNIYKALAPGGKYLCITPSRLTGPHDISMYFDTEATGFHLREYTNIELLQLFRSTGFRQTFAFLRLKGHYLKCSTTPLRIVESLLGLLPSKYAQSLAKTKLIRPLVAIRLIAVK